VEHAFTVVGEENADLLVVFPDMDPYAAHNTTYLEGRRPAAYDESKQPAPSGD
jgi:hypothetical protein